MNKIYIGIDPDVDKNGVCIYNSDKRTVKGSAMRLPALMQMFLDFPQRYFDEDRIIVVIEASWYNKKSSWHVNTNDFEPVIAKKGFNVGQCIQRGKDICELALYAAARDPKGRVSVQQRMPLRKCWHGKDGKITQEELSTICKNANVCLNNKITNQEIRDAMLLALVEANIPLIVNKFI